MSWNDNRIAWVALAAMAVLAVALSWPALPAPRRTRILAVTAGAMLAFAILFAASLEQRTARLAGTPHAAEAQLAHDPRPAIWDYAARRHGDAPLAGHGYGRGILQYDFRMFVTPGVDNPKHAHAHNTLLNVLLQGGLVGLALFAWMVVALVREMAAGLAAGRPGPGHRHARTGAGCRLRDPQHDRRFPRAPQRAARLVARRRGPRRVADYFRQNAGVKSTSIVKSSSRPRSMVTVQTQVWKSLSTE